MRRSLTSGLTRLGGGVALAGLVLAGLLAGCSSEEGGEDLDRRVEIYGLMLDWILEREEFPVVATEPDATPTVFVDHLARQIDLDVQVGLVARYEDRFELRFVDALSEAVDDEEPQAPVRNDGVLVGLGSIPDTSPFLVRAEVYRDQRSLDAFRFDLVRWGGDWVLRDEPEPVEPEGFVPGE
jgi:hypothetical protein